MDASPKDSKGQVAPTTGTSGEIFSGQQSAYEEAVQGVTEESTPQPVPAEPVPDYQPVGSIPPSKEPPLEPPPFYDDHRKKFLVLGIFLIICVLVILGVLAVIRSIGMRPKPAAKIILTYWGLWEEEQVMAPIIDDYQRSHPTVTIKYIRQDPKQYRERLQAAIDRGEGPDVFRYHSTWVPMLSSVLSPLPKTIYSDEEYQKIFYPVVSRDLRVGSNFVGIPLMIDGLMLYYNEDILRGANVQVPQTWEQVRDAIGKITVKDAGKIVTATIAMGTAENVEHFSDILGLMMVQNGTKIEKSLLTCSDPAVTTCGVEALSFYRKFAEFPSNTWDDTMENSIVAFAGGRVAMILGPSWEAHAIKTISPTLNFKTAVVPQLPCNGAVCPSVNFANYWAEGVSGKSAYQKDAWVFLKYLSQSDTMQKLYAEEVKLRPLYGEPYSRVDLGSALKDNPYLAALIAEAPTMRSGFMAARTADGDTGLNTSLINYLKNAVNSMREGTSAESAIKTADNGIQQVYSRFGIVAAPENNP
jgi:multiple sugar transport system substrate-binding protein